MRLVAAGRQDPNGRAVSPVVGVILMVAITIILAAVIAVFVLGIGVETEVAPTGTWEIDVTQDGDEITNVTVVHTGGTMITADNTDRLRVTVDGVDYGTISAADDDFPVTPGTSLIFEDPAETVAIEEDDVVTVRLVWEKGDNTAILAQRTYRGT